VVAQDAVHLCSALLKPLNESCLYCIQSKKVYKLAAIKKVAQVNNGVDAIRFNPRKKHAVKEPHEML
jgi:hypothetical protein